MILVRSERPLEAAVFVYMNPQSIYQANNALSNYGQQQAQNYQGQYQGDVGQFNQAQSNLANYRQNMPDLGQAYSQNLQGAEQQFGFNPNELKNAQQALAATQTTMANLPQAVQQSANGRGLTGAQAANRLTQQAGTMQGVLSGQANQANALSNIYGQAQGQAGAQTGFQGQSQQLNIGALQNLASNALQQQNQAGQQMDYFNGLRAQGIALNVQEQQAEASAAAAYAQAEAIRQQTEMMAQQAALQQQMSRQSSPAYQQTYNYSSPAPNYIGSLLSGVGNTLGNMFSGNTSAPSNQPVNQRGGLLRGGTF